MTSLATYSYDANGNLVSIVDTVKKEELTYQYDPQGQMVSYQAKTDGTLVTTQKNEYNGNGKRILKKDGNQEESYYYQNETLLLTVSDSQLKDFYYLGNVGNPLAVASKTSDGMKSYTYQKDVQGSTRAVTDTDGKCVEWYKYSDFGETTIHEEQAGFENVLCYTGGVYDESSGLYYLNARYYNPEMGRFISRDTYEGKNEEPSSLHLYLYCANDPVNYVDPSGHEKIATIYYRGRKKGFTEQAHYNTFYHPKNTNVKYYSILSKNEFFDAWKSIKGINASTVYIYMHGGKGVLRFDNNVEVTAKQLLKNLVTNTKLKKIYLLSCEGAAGGMQSSIAGALYKKANKRTQIYASEYKVSFDVVNDGIYTYYIPRYTNRYRFSHLRYFWKNPIKLQKY